MSDHIWCRFLTERDKKVFAAAGYGVRGQFPTRPAVFLIDCNQGHVAGAGACPGASEAIEQAARVAEAARARGIPVIHATGAVRADGWDAVNRDGVVLPSDPVAEQEFASVLTPLPRDIVVRRHAPSVFFETDLMSLLNLLGADGLVIAGGKTAGALRATVIDAFSLNLRVTIPHEACFDLWETSHALALCDLNAKHADVMPCKQVCDLLTALPAGIFDLPQGAPDQRLELMPARRKDVR